MRLILWAFYIYFMIKKPFVFCQDQAEGEEVNVVQNITASVPNGILNLDEIDWPFIFNSLITPKGLVTQFALEVETQTIFTTGNCYKFVSFRGIKSRVYFNYLFFLSETSI